MRLTAVWLLERRPRSVSALRHALRDDDAEVREAAQAALRRLENK